MISIFKQKGNINTQEQYRISVKPSSKVGPENGKQDFNRPRNTPILRETFGRDDLNRPRNPSRLSETFDPRTRLRQENDFYDDN